MNCSIPDCTRQAAPETTQCGCDYFCDCQIEPLCDPCYEAMEKAHYEWLETMGNPHFNAFYLAHLPDDDYFGDGFYIGYLQSLVRN